MSLPALSQMISPFANRKKTDGLEIIIGEFTAFFLFNFFFLYFFIIGFCNFTLSSWFSLVVVWKMEPTKHLSTKKSIPNAVCDK